MEHHHHAGGLIRAGGARKPSYGAFRAVAARPIPAPLRTTLRR